jgi:hypothetical protein
VLPKVGSHGCFLERKKKLQQWGLSCVVNAHDRAGANYVHSGGWIVIVRIESQLSLHSHFDWSSKVHDMFFAFDVFRLSTACLHIRFKLTRTY